MEAEKEFKRNIRLHIKRSKELLKGKYCKCLNPIIDRNPIKQCIECGKEIKCTGL